MPKENRKKRKIQGFLLIFFLSAILLLLFPYIFMKKEKYKAMYSYYLTNKLIIRNGKYYLTDNPNIDITFLDENGYRIVDYGGILGKQYNPVTTTFFALELSSCLANPIIKKHFLKQLEWLENNKKYVEKYDAYVWEYKFDWPDNDEKAPWLSSMAQGLIISAYARAFELTKDPSYLQAAGKTLNSFKIPIEEGGTTLKCLENQCIYKEYPHYKYAILDGFLVSLSGILEYYNFTHDSEAKKILDCGINFLLNNSEKFTAKWFECAGTYYSTMGDCTSSGYYGADMRWLEYLSTYDERLKDIYKKWLRVNNNLFCIFYRHLKNRVLYFMQKNVKS